MLLEYFCCFGILHMQFKNKTISGCHCLFWLKLSYKNIAIERYLEKSIKNYIQSNLNVVAYISIEIKTRNRYYRKKGNVKSFETWFFHWREQLFFLLNRRRIHHDQTPNYLATGCKIKKHCAICKVLSVGGLNFCSLDRIQSKILVRPQKK